MCLFKQKTAYELRISDCSSDVCSSDRYVNKNRIPGVVLGLSGGIDSALSAAVAVDALGADRVWCVMMPSRFTSRESLDDAVECARMLGVRYDSIPIEPAVEAFDAMLADVFTGRQRDLNEENRSEEHTSELKSLMRI